MITKKYTRFNKEENAFEDVILNISHYRRFKNTVSKYHKGIKISIGDLVKVNDGSGNIDFETGSKRNGIDPLFGDLALVIQTDLSFITEPFLSLGEDSRYFLDLLLLFPRGERVYTSSTFIGKVVKGGSWEYNGITEWWKWKTIK